MKKHLNKRFWLFTVTVLTFAFAMAAITGCGKKDGDTNNAVASAPVNDTFEDAYSAVGNMNIGWNLGNTLDSTGDWIYEYGDGTTVSYETAWGNPVTTKDLIRHVKELGFGAVRVPVTWTYHFDEAGNIDERWLNRVQEIVDYVLEEDMYCIINIHHDTGADGWLRASTACYEEKHQIFENIWSQVAVRFADYPEKLLFEGFNEMLDERSEWNTPNADSVQAINMYNQTFVNTVRSTGSNNAFRNLVVCTYAAAHNDSVLGGFTIPEDTAANHIIAEVHEYAPWSFTSTSATWTTMTDTFGTKESGELDYNFSVLNRYFVMKDIPLIIGEFGSEDKGNTPEREKYFSYVVSKAKEYGITCFIWDNGGEFNMGLVDRNAISDPFPTLIEAAVNAAND